MKNMAFENENNVIMEYISLFIDDLKSVLHKLEVSDIKFDNPRLTTITVVIDKKDPNTSSYVPKENTVYLGENLIKSKNLRYFINRSLLECITTKETDKGFLQGISIINDDNKFNHSLNDAITENILNLMLCDDGQDIGKYITERKNLAKLEKIVGIDTILRSYFNSDYIELENKYNSITNIESSFKDLVLLMDSLTKVNHGGKQVTTNDETLAHDIDRILINAFIKKSVMSNENVLNSDFKEFLITSSSVRGEFGFVDKPGYQDVDKNIEYYNNLIKQSQNLDYTQTHTQSL